jgi:hypothetical protein
MKLTQFLPQADIIEGLAIRVKNKYPEKGACEAIAMDLVRELKSRKISARHMVGNFKLDEPAADIFIKKIYTENDDYTVEHDWVEVEGVIVDPSASQFRNYVEFEIPDVVIANFRHPLYTKYEPMKYVRD